MSRFIFVDTSAWVASFVQSDQNHTEAVAFIENVLRRNHQFLTTDYVFDELVTRVRYQGGHQAAVKAGEELLGAESVEFLDVGPKLRQEAWRVFKKYKDQKLSFTDCTSVAVLRGFAIRDVFTFDDDFSKLGFTKLP